MGALALVFVVFWPENYGGGEDKDTKAAAWNLIKSDRKALLLGTVNALFEGSMYSFVFMWVPTMLSVLKGSPLPNGLVFASMMTCISLGGVLFSPSMLLSLAPAEHLGVGCFVVGALALLVPVFSTDIVPVLGAFLVFETCVGIFQPCGGVLRSKVIPDHLQGSVMNMFRIPLNSLRHRDAAHGLLPGALRLRHHDRLDARRRRSPGRRDQVSRRGRAEGQEAVSRCDGSLQSQARQR